VRHGSGEEQLCRTDLHPTVPDAAAARHPAQAQPPAGGGRRHAASRRRRLHRAGEHPTSPRVAASAGRSEVGARTQLAPTLTLDGSPQHIDEGTTGTGPFAGTASIIALRIDGELRDLDTVLADGQAVEGVDISSPDGLSILRHSTAHVLAQAVQRTNPDAKR